MSTEVLVTFLVWIRICLEQNWWESLPYKALKKLKKLLKIYGIRSAFTYNLLVAVGDTYDSIWLKILLQMILSPMQYTVYD